MTTSLPQIPESLIAQLARHQVVPFIGSGVSLGVQPKRGEVPGLFPTWPELIEKLAVRLAGDTKANKAMVVRGHAGDGELLEAAEVAVKALGLP